MRSQTFGILTVLQLNTELLMHFFVETLPLRKMSSASGKFMPRPPTGALPLEPTGGLPSPDPLFCVVQEDPLKLYCASYHTLFTSKLSVSSFL